jgi:type III pantothenate kinase
MSFLALDVGNTRLKWAWYAHAEPGAVPLHQGAAFLETIDQLIETDWRGLPPPQTMLGCMVAAAGIRQRIEEQLEAWDLVPRWVVPGAAGAGVVNGYDHPHRLGADRWVALVGARQRVLAAGRPRPAVVVMVGTAVTVDALDTDGCFLGGLILPGHGIMLRALEGGTAGLRVPTGEVRDFPTNTSDALTSGGTDAITGAIERMCRRLAARAGEPPIVVMTGGAGWKVAPYLGVEHELVESLLFDGLLVLQSSAPVSR